MIRFDRNSSILPRLNHSTILGWNMFPEKSVSPALTRIRRLLRFIGIISTKHYLTDYVFYYSFNSYVYTKFVFFKISKYIKDI